MFTQIQFIASGKGNFQFFGILQVLVFGFLILFSENSVAQQTVFWRDNAANGNFENGNCADIGTPPSQWWYPSFTPNNARNRPDCFDGSTNRHNVNIDNNHQTTMSTNTAFWGLRSLTFVNTATSNRTINSSPDDNTRGISVTNGIYNNGNTGVTHTFNTRIGIDASTVTLSTATSGATTTYNREIFGNSNQTIFDGSGSTNVATVISGTGATVTKNGTGNLTLSGTIANTFTGATTVNGGTLVLNKSANIVAIPGALTANTGVTVRTDAANQWGTGTPPLVTLNGTALLNLNNNNQRISLAGTSSTASITLGSGTLDINNTGTDTYAGGISGTGGVTKSNTGIEIFQNSGLSFTGATTITAGELRLNPSANATYASQVILNGGILGTTGITATRTWTSSSTLNLAANSTINLASAVGHTLTFANSSGVSWTSNVILTITGWQGSYNGTAGTQGRIFIGAASNTLTNQQLSQIVFNNGTNNFSAVLLSNGELVASGNIIIPWTNTGTATAWYTSTNWTPNTSSGAWTTSNIAQFNNTGTANTAGINMGTSPLSIGAIQVSSLRTRALTIGNSSATAGNLTLNGAVVNGLANTILSNNSTFLLTVQDNETGSGKTMNVVLGNTTDNLVNCFGTGGITVSSVIQGVSRNLSKTGTGTLTVSGANTYGGSTTINQGTLACGAANTLPSTTSVSLANTSGAILSLGTNSQSITSLSGGGSTGGNVSITSAGVLTINGASPANNTSYGGVISGTGALVKTGTSVLTLTNINNHSFTGTTTITNGEVRLNPGANVTYASQVVLNGGVLSTTGITASRTWTSSSTLNLNVSSTISLGSNVHTITFAASNGVSWAGTTLTVDGWTGSAGSSGTAGRIFVGSTNTGLTAGQLAKINFTGYGTGALILSTGEVVPSAAPVSYTWVGFTDGNWATAANWSPSGPPTSIDHVTLTNGSTGAFANLNLNSAVSVADITFNGTGSFFTVGSSGSITASGNVTYTSGSGSWDCASTFSITSSSDRTIPPFNYGNLNATGGNRTLPSSGTVGICGTFTRGAGTYTVAGSTVDYNGTGAQTISAGSYNNLTISNARGSANLTSPSGTIAVGGTFNVSTLSAYTPVVNASSIFDFTGAGSQTIPAFFYGQLNNTGNGPRTMASSGIVDISQGFTPTTGTTTMTGSTIRYSNTSATTWNLSVFTTNFTSPVRQYNNLIFNGGASTIWSQNGNTIGVVGDLTVTSGTLLVGSAGGSGILNVDGNISIDGTSGTLNVSNTAASAGTINLSGSFSQSNGTFSKSAAGATGTFNFAKTVSSPVQTISQTGGTITNSGTTWNLGTGSTTNTVELATGVTMSGGTVNANDQAIVDFKTFVLTSTGTFVANTGTTLISANTNATGAIMTSGSNGSVQATTRTFTNAGVNYTFNGTSAQFTGTAIGAAANIGTLNLSNTSGANPALTFTSSPTVATVLNVNNGINQLGSNNITISANIAGAITGGSSTAFIQTNGSGRLIRAIATAGLPITYNFPIGTSTNYTPASFNFTANAGAMNLIVGTVGSRNSNDVTPTDYINNRYWVTNLSGSPSTYTYSSQFTFITSPTDVVGTIGNIRLNRFGGTNWTEDAASSASGSTLSSGTLSETSGSLSATAEWAGRVNPPFATYTWDGSSNGDWDVAANWDLNAVPSSASDVIIIPDVASYTNPLAITGTRAVADFTVQPNGTFSMSAGSQLTVNGTYANTSSTAPTFSCTSTLILNTSSSYTLPAASYGNLNLAGGPRTLPNSTINICGNYTPGTSTTVGTSTVNFNGTTAQAINTNAAAFATLTISNTSDTVSANADVSASTAFNVSAGASFNQAAGTLAMTGATATINGTLRNLTSNNFVGGAITFTSTGVYEHRRNSGVIPTATWNTGSNCLITGTTSAVPSGGLSQTFSDFTWRTSLMSSGNNLSGALTSVRNLNIQTTNGQNLGLVATTAFTGTVSGNLNISGGNLIVVTGANNNNIALNVSGNVSLIGAGSLILSSGSGTGTAALNVTGTFTNSSTNASSFVVNSGTKTVAVSAIITGAYNHNGTGTASVNTNATANTVSLITNGGYTIGSGIQNVSNGGAATFTVGTGTTLTVSGGTLIGSATAHTSTINANGNVAVSSGTLTLANLASSTSNMTMANNNTMTVSGTGTVNVAVAGAGNLNIGTSTSSVTTTALTINGGSLVLASGGTGIINAYADLNLSSGTLSRSAGTATLNFLKPGVDAVNRGTSTITQSTGTISGTIAINIGNGTLIYPLLVLGSSTINIGTGTTLTVTANGMIDCGASNVLTGGTFTLNTQGTLVTANTAGITTGASGSIQTTTRNFGTLGYFIYNGTSAQVTGNAFPASCAIFSIFNSTGVTLTSPLTVAPSGQLILFLSPFGGILDIANNNLTLSGASVVGASSTNYIRTSGTGRVIKSVSTSAVLFEVGNSTYNPITLTPSAGTNIPYQVRAIDGVTSPAPNDGTKLIDRYWSVTAPTAPANTLTLNGQWATGNQNANYNAGTQVVVAYHNGTNWTQVNSTQAGAGPFTSSGAFSVTAAIINTGITFGIGKDNGFIGTFTWNGSASSLWTNQNNWTPVSGVGGPIATDNVVINVPGTNVLDISSAITINNFELSGTGTFTMGAAGALTINGDLTYSSSATPTLNCASTINIAKSTSQPIPPFTYGNLNATGGDRVLSNTGTIGICGTFTRGAGTYTVTGSTVNFLGTSAQTIPAGTYNNLTISNARGSATLTLASGTIDVAGTFNPTVSAYVPSFAGNTINLSGPDGSPLPAFTYYNLSSSNNTRTWASSGTIDVNGIFTPASSALQIVTGSSVRLSSTAATTISIPSFSSTASPRHFNNLEVVGGASTFFELASGFNMGCAGNFTHTGTGTFTVCNNAGGNTMTVNGSMTISGGGSVRITNSNAAGALNIAGNTSISSGNVTCVGASAVTGGNATYSTTDFTINPAGQLILEGATTSGTAAASVTINGLCTISSSTANAINLGVSTTTNANNIINLKGNFTKSGTGTIGLSGVFASSARLEFNLGSGTQTWSHAGAAMTAGSITVGSGSTLQLNSNMVLGSNASSSTLTVIGTLDAGTFTVTPGNAANGFAMQAGSTLITTNVAGISGTISGFTNANTSWASGAPAGGAAFIFNGNNVNTGFSGYANILNGGPNNSYNITWNGTGTITMDKTMYMHNVSYNSSGRFYLNANNLTISSTGTLSGAPFSVNKMFVVTTGSLIRSVQNTGVGLPFTWPIGEETGTAEYSPATVNSIAGAGVNGTIGFNVVDGTQPNNSPAVSYITRYWPTLVTGFNVGYTLSNLTFTYDAGDIVVGPETSLRGNSYNTSVADWTQYASSSCASNVLTITSGIGGSNMPTNGTYDITARIDVPVYYRTVNSGPWQTLTNWEVSSDPAFVTPPPATPSVAPNNINSEGIFIRNTHAITSLLSFTADDLTIENGGSLEQTNNSFTLANGTASPDMTINSGGLFRMNSTNDNAFIIATSASLLVNGTMRQSGLGSPDITNSGTINIGSTGTYNHNRNAGIIPTATWASGSTCLLDAVTNNMPSGLGQTFHHFTVNTTLGASVNCSGNLQTINGDFNLTTNHATNEFRLSTGSAYTLTIGGNFNITNAFFSPASGGSGPCNVVVNGTTTMTGASSQFNKTGAATVNLTFNGDYTQNAGTFDFNSSGSSNTTVNFRGNVVWNGTINRTNGGTHTVNFDKSSGLQTLNVGATFGAGAVSWNVGTGSTTNILRLLSNLALNNSTQTFTVANNATMDFQAFVLSGGNTTFTTGASPTLMIGSPAGIMTAGNASGNIQTLVRTVNGTTTYIYTGAANQNSGNLLPSTLTGAGRLTISNTGAASDNTVTLTNTLPMTTPQLNLTSGLLAVGTGQTIIISSGGAVNGTGGDFATGATGGMVRFSTPAGGAFNGNLNPFNVETNGNPCGVNFGAQTVTIQNGGTFNINAGGFVNLNPPAYAVGSNLQYSTGASYGRGLEWSTNSGKGYPHHVLVSTTTLNPASAGAVNANVPFRCGGNLTIATGGNIYMDFSGNNMIEDLRVLGSLNLIGQLSGSQTAGSDIFIGDNWTNNGTGANFFPNGREVVFNGSTIQNIQGSNTTVPAFAFLAISNTSGDVNLNFSSASTLTVNNRLQLNSGKLILNNHTLVLAPGCAAMTTGDGNNYVVTNGTGVFRQQVLNNASDFWFPVGPSTTVFGPITMNQAALGTTDNIDVRVVVAPAFTNAVNDNLQMVNLEWRLTEGTAGGNRLTNTYGWRTTSEATNFLRDEAVYVGNWNAAALPVPRYAFQGTNNPLGGSNPWYATSTASQPFTGNLSPTRAFVVGNINGILPCFQTQTAGDWNTGTNWVGGVVPPTDALTCIGHAMTVGANPPNPGGITFQTGGNVTVSTGVTITVTDNGIITNGSGSARNFGGGTIAFEGLGLVNGANSVTFNNLQLNGNTTFTTVPSITNEMEILPGGFVISANGPIYGPSSTLKYNTGGPYNRGNEWRSTSGAGWPANVLVTGNTSLNLDAGTGVNRTIQGNMQIDNGSSVSQGATGFNLTVPGNFILSGSYTQSTTSGGDLVLGGNWSSAATATLTANNRDVRFNGNSGTQTIANLASGLQFGFLTIDNSGTGVDLLNTITANTFRVNVGRTFNLTTDQINISSNGNVLINGTFNANSGTIQYLNGGSFTNNGTFNRGTSTVDFLPNASFNGLVSGSVQTNFHNIFLGSNSGIDFNSGALRGRVSGVFQVRNGSFCVGNAPIYEAGSKLMYSGGGTFNRNVEWDPATLQKVEVRNNTTLKCGANGTSFSHVMADSLIVQSGSSFDMTVPDMTAPTVVGGSVLLRGTLNLSNSAGGDLQVAGDWNNNGGTFNCNGRLTTFDGALNAQINGPTSTTFCFLTVNKASANSITASVPFTVSRPPAGTEVRVAGGILNLNGQAITLGAGTNTLRVNSGYTTGQTLRTGGTSISGFNTYTDDGVTTSTLGGRVDYSGTSAETYSSNIATYYQLWNTGGSTKTLPQNTVVRDALWIDPSTTIDFAATAFNLEVRGDVTNQGSTIGSSTGAVILNGTATQNMSGNGTYRNLEINKSTNDVNSTGTPTISSKLNVLSGKILQASVSDSITLSLSATITETIGGSEHFVRGKLSTTRVVGTSAETFGGMGINLTAGANLGTVIATRQSGIALNGNAPCCAGFSTIFRNWTIVPSFQPSVANRNLSLTWPSQDDNGMYMVSMQLWKRSNTNIATPWIPVDFLQDVSASNPRTATWTGVTSFSQFTGADIDNPLPLGLISFKGKNVNGNALLNWELSKTESLIGYRVMKSLDGKSFQEIGFVAETEAKSGLIQKEFLDKNLVANSYYKIGLIATTGKVEWSQVVLVRKNNLGKVEFALMPNPASEGTRIGLDGISFGSEKVELSLFGIDGKSLLTLKGELSFINSELEKFIKTLSKGIYQIRLTALEEVNTLRLLKE